MERKFGGKKTGGRVGAVKKFFSWVKNIILALGAAITIYFILKKKKQPDDIDSQAAGKIEEIKKQNEEAKEKAKESIKNETDYLSITDIVARLRARLRGN